MSIKIGNDPQIPEDSKKENIPTNGSNDNGIDQTDKIHKPTTQAKELSNQVDKNPKQSKIALLVKKMIKVVFGNLDESHIPEEIRENINHVAQKIFGNSKNETHYPLFQSGAHTVVVLNDVKLGDGAYKKVFKSLMIEITGDISVKMAAFGDMELKGERAKKSAIAEKKIMLRLNSLRGKGELNEFIIKTHSVVDYTKKDDLSIERMGVITEFCNGGSLKGKSLTPAEKKQVAVGILKGLIALHNAKIFHADVKSENILLQYNDEDELIGIKLSDFGTSVDMSEKGEKFYLSGDPNFRAPEINRMIKKLHKENTRKSPAFKRANEVKNGNEINRIGLEMEDLHREKYCKIDNAAFKADVWGFGMLLEELVPEDHRSEEMKALIKGLKRKNPTKRLSAQEALDILEKINVDDFPADEDDGENDSSSMDDLMNAAY